eukprot:m.57632 g.57632  ORF g.57632 m.57632 type:complete len:323 (+) comp12120_c0_seq2:80-1048(+)
MASCRHRDWHRLNNKRKTTDRTNVNQEKKKKQISCGGVCSAFLGGHGTTGAHTTAVNDEKEETTPHHRRDDNGGNHTSSKRGGVLDLFFHAGARALCHPEITVALVCAIDDLADANVLGAVGAAHKLHLRLQKVGLDGSLGVVRGKHKLVRGVVQQPRAWGDLEARRLAAARGDGHGLGQRDVEIVKDRAVAVHDLGVDGKRRADGLAAIVEDGKLNVGGTVERQCCKGRGVAHAGQLHDQILQPLQQRVGPLLEPQRQRLWHHRRVQGHLEGRAAIQPLHHNEEALAGNGDGAVGEDQDMLRVARGKVADRRAHQDHRVVG